MKDNNKGMVNGMKLWHFAAIFIILNILDIATTQTALTLGAHELNPLMQSGNIYIIKALGIIGILVVAWNLRKTALGERCYNILSKWTCAVFGLAVLNNSFWILRAGGYL